MLMMSGAVEITTLIGKDDQMCKAVSVILKRATDAALSQRNLNKAVQIKRIIESSPFLWALTDADRIC